jgi:hypothetical protein
MLIALQLGLFICLVKPRLITQSSPLQSHFTLPLSTEKGETSPAFRFRSAADAHSRPPNQMLKSKSPHLLLKGHPPSAITNLFTPTTAPSTSTSTLSSPPLLKTSFGTACKNTNNTPLIIAGNFLHLNLRKNDCFKELTNFFKI